MTDSTTAPVVLVGVGALGSHLALFARNWVAPLRIVDFDRVEQRNLAAQFHGRQGKGRNKAQALQQLLQGLWGRKVESRPHRLEDTNAEQLLGDARLVIDATDNAATRRRIQDFILPREIPCLHAALSADASFARIVWSEHFTADEEGAPGQATCEDDARLPFFALAAAHAALVAQDFLAEGSRRSVQLTEGAVTRLA